LLGQAGKLDAHNNAILTGPEVVWRIACGWAERSGPSKKPVHFALLPTHIGKRIADV
jgi:hypothetical protein